MKCELEEMRLKYVAMGISRRKGLKVEMYTLDSSI
jgi:hypothetical protein